VLNQLIASLSAAFALSLGFVQHQGIDIDLFMQILRAVPYAPTFDKSCSGSTAIMPTPTSDQTPDQRHRLVYR